MPDPILVVGAGPTGLTAALELSRFGVPVRLIDRLDAPATTSRAIGVQARTLELMQQRGLADEMIRLGNRAVTGSVFGDGKRLFRIDFSRVPSRFNHLLLLSQAETERILREAAERQGVVVERGVELVGIAQDPLSHDPSPVRAVLRHADGTLEQVRAPWLISAEGAHSVVRTTLDLQFEGKTFDDHYALGDLHIEGGLPESDVGIFSSSHGFMVVFPMGGDHFRLIANNPFSPADDASPPTLEELQRLWDQRSPLPARLHDLVWGSWFRINSRMVPRLRVGRLLLGGDAAHIHSPAGGQGMNTGVQDMINLGWKLALVTRGEAPDALLDTYAQDRLPVMREVLFNTENMTDVISSENPLFRTMFDHVAPLVAGASIMQDNATARLSQVAIGYRGSPLSENRAHGGGLHAGDRVPDLQVRHRVDGAWRDARLLDLLDPSRLALLVALGKEDARPDQALLEEAAGWGDKLVRIELASPPGAEARSAYDTTMGHGGSLYLVRPDGYVGLAVGEHSAVRALREYAARWFVAGAKPARGDQAAHAAE